MRAPDELQKIWSDPQRLEKWTIKQLDACIVQTNSRRHQDDRAPVGGIREEISRAGEGLPAKRLARCLPGDRERNRDRIDAARKQKDAVRKKGARVTRGRAGTLELGRKGARRGNHDRCRCCSWTPSTSCSGLPVPTRAHRSAAARANGRHSRRRSLTSRGFGIFGSSLSASVTLATPHRDLDRRAASWIARSSS